MSAREDAVASIDAYRAEIETRMLELIKEVNPSTALYTKVPLFNMLNPEQFKLWCDRFHEEFDYADISVQVELTVRYIARRFASHLIVKDYEQS